jgi:DNA-binding NarL/FixJ family response regulator
VPAYQPSRSSIVTVDRSQSNAQTLVEPVSILIADDDARVRHALRALIELDPRIQVAGEALSSWEVLASDRALQPTVILLDLILPEVEDGLDLLKVLTRSADRRVVAMSLRSGLRDEAIAAGAAAFVEKGMPPDLFLSTLCEACGAGAPGHAN